MRRRSHARAAAVLVVLALVASACTFAIEIDGDLHRVRVLLPTGAHTATATETRTPAPTPTSTPTATVTPAASATPLYGTDVPPPPTLTPTPTPSATPVFPTPTPDVIEPTPGPSSTPEPTRQPDDLLCYAGTQYNLNIRSGPGTGYSAVGRLAQSDRVQVDSLYVYDTRNEWAHLVDGRGWIALIYDGDTLAWLDDAAPCWELPSDGPGAQPAPPMIGFKTVPGASADVLTEFARRLPDGVRAVAFVVQDTQLSTQLHGAGIYTVFVPWSAFPGDCPNTSMAAATSANDRVRYVDQQVGAAAFDAVVLANECAWPSAEYYAAWALAAMDLCDARGWRCVPHVWNTGAPELDWLPELDAMHCEMQARGHAYGANIYPYWPVSLMSDDQRTVYTTWRHRMIQARMECDPQWYVTELAPDGGGWSPDVQDTAGYIAATWGDFAAVGVWYTGNALGAWPDAAWSATQMYELAEMVG